MFLLWIRGWVSGFCDALNAILFVKENDLCFFIVLKSSAANSVNSVSMQFVSAWFARWLLYQSNWTRTQDSRPLSLGILNTTSSNLCWLDRTIGWWLLQWGEWRQSNGEVQLRIIHFCRWRQVSYCPSVYILRSNSVPTLKKHQRHNIYIYRSLSLSLQTSIHINDRDLHALSWPFTQHHQRIGHTHAVPASPAGAPRATDGVGHTPGKGPAWTAAKRKMAVQSKVSKH